MNNFLKNSEIEKAANLLIDIDKDLVDSSYRIDVLKKISLLCLEFSVTQESATYSVTKIMESLHKTAPETFLTIFRRSFYPFLKNKNQWIENLVYFDLTIDLAKIDLDDNCNCELIINKQNQQHKSNKRIFYQLLIKSIKGWLNTIPFFSDVECSKEILMRHEEFVRPLMSDKRIELLRKNGIFW